MEMILGDFGRQVVSRTNCVASTFCITSGPVRLRCLHLIAVVLHCDWMYAELSHNYRGCQKEVHIALNIFRTGNLLRWILN